ncbi:lysine--tRNA ligase [Candidatus Profftella armatura (Diaphorina cf. continua)]|uniref:Lysine--tRNA ligase n=1 Tax=Candidatus Profftella armatura (Diaphorina cf. continua) TaxID=2661583 RepID=A0A7R6VYI1_9PROT|nr:lysine--tRNA ligase [Candidatus Profftella armatura (Diaphorina cf. continua)]BCG49432.1 lysine--tRNA ligase [Candidatus Profftella armatura (Diaphorina cf. continua)]
MDENTIISERRSKLDLLRKKGFAFPNDFYPLHNANDLHIHYDNIENFILKQKSIFTIVAGRMMLKRIMGKISFIILQDASGPDSNGRIQLYISSEIIGKNLYTDFKHYDIGDILGAKGTLFKTNTGELSIKVSSLKLITKSLRPLPNKFQKLSNREIKYRHRYIDLIINENTRKVFKKRTQIISSIRRFMEKNDFMEVETPILHNKPGGAIAKPFITHHNSLNMKMFLRIAPELYLKRLIIGGFNKIFEINKNFRNEGISPRHNPEFTMIEFYTAYTDYIWLMKFIEKMIKKILIDCMGTTKINYQGHLLDFNKSFEKLTIIEAIKKYTPQYSEIDLQNKLFLKSELKKINPKFNKRKILTNLKKDILQLMLFEETTETKLWNPTYITNYPTEISPLARKSNIANNNITERFELFIIGNEIANGFSELNDPEEQAVRFKNQIDLKNEMNGELSSYYDIDYIHALEYGMPPASGCGIGVDRLIMLLTNSTNIRDVIFFPHLRKEN